MSLFGVYPRSLARVVCSARASGVLAAGSSRSSSRHFSSLLCQTTPSRPSRSSPILLSLASSRSISLFSSSDSSPSSPAATSVPPPSSVVDDSLLAASAQTTPSTPPPSASDSIASSVATPSPSSPASAVNFPSTDADLTAAFDVNDILPPDNIELMNLAQIPMELGDLRAMGLGNWLWPTGVLENFLEFLHVCTGLPWWATIVVGTACLRAVMFKAFLTQARTTGRMLKVQPETLLIQADMAKAKKAKDTTAVNYNAGRLQALYKKNGINPFAMLGGVLLTVPFQISMFFSLRSMANLPVPQFLVGGTAWFPDLTMADPTYILPVAACGATWLLGHLGQHGASPKTQANNNIALSFAMKTGALVAFPAMSGFKLPAVLPLIGGVGFPGFPAAVLLYWTTTNTLAVCQSLLVRIPAVRNYFDLPDVPVHTRPVGEPVPTGYQAARMWWAEKMQDGRDKAMDQERKHLEKQRKAGVVARKKVLDIDRLGKSMYDAPKAQEVLEPLVETLTVQPSRSNAASNTPHLSQRPTNPAFSRPSTLSSPPPAAPVSKIDAIRAKRIALARQIEESEAKAAAAAAAAKEARKIAREKARQG